MYPNDALSELNQTNRQLRAKLKRVDTSSESQASLHSTVSSGSTTRGETRGGPVTPSARSTPSLPNAGTKTGSYVNAHLHELNEQLFKYNRHEFVENGYKRMKLLLISNSVPSQPTPTQNGYDRNTANNATNGIADAKFLAHCSESITRFLGEQSRNICFIPFASSDWSKSTEAARRALGRLGYEVHGIQEPLSRPDGLTSSDLSETLANGRKMTPSDELSGFQSHGSNGSQGSQRSSRSTSSSSACSSESSYQVLISNIRTMRKHLKRCDAIYIGDTDDAGNSYRLLYYLWHFQLIEVIRKRVILDAVPLIATSVGVNVLCLTAATCCDMAVMQPPTIKALSLLPFQIVVKYRDCDGSVYEKNAQNVQINEFLKEHGEIPVVGMEDGCVLVVKNGEIKVQGTNGAMMFSNNDVSPVPPCGTLTCLFYTNLAIKSAVTRVG